MVLKHTSNWRMKTCLEPIWDTEPFCTNEGVCTWICITLWHIKENAQADVPLWFSKLWTAKLLCRPIIICGFLSIILQFYPSNEQREEEGASSACCITFSMCVLCERWGSVYRGGAGWRWGFSTSSWWDKLDVYISHGVAFPCQYYSLCECLFLFCVNRCNLVQTCQVLSPVPAFWCTSARTHTQ